MSFWGKLFGTDAAVGKALDAAISAGDKVWYTKEEKAEMNLKMQEWYLRYLEATQPMNVSRRLIACVVTGIWAFFLSMATTLALLNSSDNAEFVFKVMEHNVNTPFSIIIGFYFAAHIVRNLNNK